MRVATLVAWGEDRLGLSPTDRQRFDQAVAEGDVLLYLACGLMLVGLVIMLVGVIRGWRGERRGVEE